MIGYQHSVVGRQMLNYAPQSNPDGLASIPDRILCSGSATAGQLVEWGIPANQVSIGGARRLAEETAPDYARDAPVFLPLPFDKRVSAEMIAAAKSVPGKTFLVKNHPMTPYAFSETDTVRRTDQPLCRVDWRTGKSDSRRAYIPLPAAFLYGARYPARRSENRRGGCRYTR